MLFLASNRHDSRRLRVQIYTFFLIYDAFKDKVLFRHKEINTLRDVRIWQINACEHFCRPRITRITRMTLVRYVFRRIVCSPCLLRQTRLRLGLENKFSDSRPAPCSNRRSNAKALHRPRRVGFSASLSHSSTGRMLHIINWRLTLMA